MNPVFSGLATSIFEEMTIAAGQAGAINLGQGFPDEDGPIHLRRAAAEALLTRSNQYPPMRGLPELRTAVAAHYNCNQGLAIDASHVTVTSGATEAIAAALLAVVTPGDEVLVIQPAYDAYVPLIRRAGGIPRFVTIDPPEWRLTEPALAAAVTQATRAIIVNDPHNPIARAYSAEEVAMLGRLCAAHDLVAICDEVWENVVFDGRGHHPLWAEPGMATRAVKIGSAGKIFSMTGWKVGWAIADPALGRPIARAHQYLTFTVPPALQAAVAQGLVEDSSYLNEMRSRFQASRDRITGALAAGGYAVGRSEATYFLSLDLPASGIDEPALDFCRRIVRDHGVAAIPLPAFYVEGPAPQHVRVAFPKSAATLDEAARRLVAARG